jgi:hypothetical protein
MGSRRADGSAANAEAGAAAAASTLRSTSRRFIEAV